MEFGKNEPVVEVLRLAQFVRQRLPEAVRKEVNRLTLIAYKRLNCRGVVRIDFIIKGDTPYMIEINTIPGMSSHSIIPQQAAAMGMSLTELFNLVIAETSK